MQEFWGVEVEPGQNYAVKVHPSEVTVLHLSLACVSEVRKGKGESAVIYANVDGKKFVIGTLSADKIPQITYDLVFEKSFELSHSSKNESVYFTGYMSYALDLEEGFPDTDDLCEDTSDRNEKMGTTVNDDGDNSAEVEPTLSAKKMSESDDVDSSDEVEPTPPKAKRTAEAANMNASPGDKKAYSYKKAKLDTPQKPDDSKRGGGMHQGSPHPEGGKTLPGGVNKSNNKSPKSTGAPGTNSASPGDKKAYRKARLGTPQKSDDSKRDGGKHQGSPHPDGGKTPPGGVNKSNNKSPKSTGACGSDSASPGDTKASRKVKFDSPQKSDDSKRDGGKHQGSPHPEGGKTPAGGVHKSNKSPKSTGASGTDSALLAHSKAKRNT